MRNVSKIFEILAKFERKFKEIMPKYSCIFKWPFHIELHVSSQWDIGLTRYVFYLPKVKTDKMLLVIYRILKRDRTRGNGA